MWGPFEVDANRYALACQQAATLESGRGAVPHARLARPQPRRCRTASTRSPTPTRSVSRYRQPVLRVGEPGTSSLAEKYLRSGAFVGGAATHDWLIPALGLDRYPVIRRRAGRAHPAGVAVDAVKG